MRDLYLSLVLVTGYSLLWAVTAQDLPPTLASPGPANVRIVSSTLTAGQPYTVTWDGCTSKCAVLGFTLLELQPANTQISTGRGVSIQSGEAGPCSGMNNGIGAVAPSCATNTAPTNLDPTNTYEIDLVWRTTLTEGIQITHQVGGPLIIDPTPFSMISSSASSATTSIANAGAAGSIGSPHPSVTSSSTINTAVSTPISPSTTTSNSTDSGISSDSSSLSTGAKVGIAIGAAGFALLVLIAALLIWRRSRQRQLRALPNNRMTYPHETDSPNRDFVVEKEMHVINSPVDTLHNGYSSIPPVSESQTRSPRGSYPLPEDQAPTSAVASGVAYAGAHEASHGPDFEGSASSAQESQANVPPPAAVGAAIQRKPVGATSGTTYHLREPGMSDEEVARLEEEERRLDEAIEEAERRRRSDG